MAFLVNLLSVDPVRETWNLKLACNIFLALLDRAFRNSPNKLCLFWEQICLWPASELMLVFLVSDPEQSSVLSCYEQLSSVLELTMAFATHDHSSGTNTSDTSDDPVADIQEVVWTPVKNVLWVHNLLILKCYQNAVTASGRRLEVCFCCSFADNFSQLFCAIISFQMQQFIIVVKTTFTSLSFLTVCCSIFCMFMWFLYLAVTFLYCVVGRFRKWTSVSFCFFFY